MQVLLHFFERKSLQRYCFFLNYARRRGIFMQIFGFFPYKSADRGIGLSTEEKATGFVVLFFFPCFTREEMGKICRQSGRGTRMEKSVFCCGGCPKSPIYRRRSERYIDRSGYRDIDRSRYRHINRSNLFNTLTL